jgi:hypothetical protein
MSLQQLQLFMTSMLLLPLPLRCAPHLPPLFRMQAQVAALNQQQQAANRPQTSAAKLASQ